MSKGICVFCGSQSEDQRADNTALMAGRLIAESKRPLVYGGGGIGMMGKVADGTLDAGGEVIGIIPHFLMKSELAHARVNEMHVVQSMFERKQKMFDLSAAFLTLPGGYGTLDEVFEVITHNKLGQIHSPLAIYNEDGFFDPFFKMLDSMESKGYLKRAEALGEQVLPDYVILENEIDLKNWLTAL